MFLILATCVANYETLHRSTVPPLHAAAQRSMLCIYYRALYVVANEKNKNVWITFLFVKINFYKIFFVRRIFSAYKICFN